MFKCIKRFLGTITLAAMMVPHSGHTADLFDRGKLLATGGVSQIEGAGGAGLSSWALITGYGTDRGVGMNAHHTYARLSDFTLNATGIAVGIHDRVELSYAHQWFDTRKAGARLGLGQGFTFEQDVVGAKVRLFGDAVYDQDRLLPQVSLGINYKKASEGDLVRALGARDDDGTDFYLAATKILLDQSLLLNATARLTAANQFGLLGFGNAAGKGRSLQAELSAVYLLDRQWVVGVDYRTKPDNLAFAEEDNSGAAYVVFLPNKYISLTFAGVLLGDIALQGRQSGYYMSLQAGF